MILLLLLITGVVASFTTKEAGVLPLDLTAVDEKPSYKPAAGLGFVLDPSAAASIISYHALGATKSAIPERH